MSRERRQYPRANVDLVIRTEDGSDEIRAVDLSAAGVAFHSPRWIEAFTKLEVVFVFPPAAAGYGHVGDERLVRVDAVVMRTVPEDPDDSVSSYRVACCFTSIREDDKAFIADYVESILAREAAEASGT